MGRARAAGPASVESSGPTRLALCVALLVGPLACNSAASHDASDASADRDSGDVLDVSAPDATGALDGGAESGDGDDGGPLACPADGDTICTLQDDGTANGVARCITCCQKRCTGATQLFQLVASCVCEGGPCTGACGGAGDYCASPGQAATVACQYCLSIAMAEDSGCAAMVNPACAANADCTAYVACSDTRGCP